MKKSVYLLLLILLLGSFEPPESHQLQVKIYDLKNTNGNVVVMIYNKDGSIPDKTFTKYYRKKVVDVTNKRLLVTFENLPNGKYAVNVFHDENNNGKLDKGFIKPKEGFGLTNFKSVNLLNRPNFKKASFKFNNDTLVKIKMIYL
jgi:uncharacterized protein (DUF2141 family)